MAPCKTTEVDSVLRVICSTRPRIVGIDGIPRSGKTTLAYGIGRKLSCSVIDLDIFLENDIETFMTGLCFGDLKRCMSRLLLRSSSSPIIVSGLCLKDVFQTINVTPNLMLYTIRKGISGYCDFDILDHLESADAIVPTEIYENMPVFRKEIFDYHMRVNPLTNSDVIFEWTEDQGSA